MADTTRTSFFTMVVLLVGFGIASVAVLGVLPLPAQARADGMSDRVELQLEVDAPRAAVFALLATADGLQQWLDAAELDPRVGGAVRLRAARLGGRGQGPGARPAAAHLLHLGVGR